MNVVVCLVIKCAKCGVYLEDETADPGELRVKPCWGCVRDEIKASKEAAKA